MRAMNLTGYSNVPNGEPFAGLFTQGMVIHESYGTSAASGSTPKRW
jgi:leucyl-tRNA synthetase